jgi:hypothetical protein
MLFLKPEHGPCGSSETPSSARNARNSQPWLGRAHQRDRGCTGAMVDRRLPVLKHNIENPASRNAID